MAEIFNFENMSAIDLLEVISWKEEYPNEAELAFSFFTNKYQQDILQKAEIYCSKFNYNEVVALLVANCTFARVWKYPTFDISKSKTKDIDKAVIIWMAKILWTQIVLFKERDTCAEPSQEEDLSLVYTLDELIELHAGTDIEKRNELKVRLEIIERALIGLSDKHRIIYLTYKVYEQVGKNIPRSVSKKLKDQLDLTQSTIRVYKKEANEHVKSFLDRNNGNR